MPRRPAGATQIVEALLSKVAPETQKKFGAQGKHFVTKRDIYWHLDKLGCLEFSEIIEIGANSGQDTLVLLNISPSAQIHAFEPDPRAIAAFKMKEFPPRVTLFETAISAISGVTTFYPSDKWGDNAWHQSGSIRNPKNHLEKYPEVTFSEVVILPTSTLDGWSEKYGIGEVDFIWADVQGAELDMIRGGLETLGRTRYLYTEYSNDELYEGQISLEELLTLLPNFRVVADFGGDVLLRNLSRTLG
jgi:FkbM family methyltransferase